MQRTAATPARCHRRRPARNTGSTTPCVNPASRPRPASFHSMRLKRSSMSPINSGLAWSWSARPRTSRATQPSPARSRSGWPLRGARPWSFSLPRLSSCRPAATTSSSTGHPSPPNGIALPEVPGAASLLRRRAPTCPTATVIDVVVVDDHPAVRAGLVALLRGEPGIVPVATAGGVDDGLTSVERCSPNVALVDYDLRDGNGLELCYEPKALAVAPAVLMYSAFAPDGLALAARAANADGLLEKVVTPDELFAT